MLQVRDIKKHFGPVEVLKGISFDLAAGECIAVVGDNGAGKSTLMKIITGVYSANHGAVVLDGNTITGSAPNANVLASGLSAPNKNAVPASA